MIIQLFFLENEIMYGEKFEVEEAVLGSDFLIPIGKANIERKGKDITIVSFSRSVGICLKAASILSEKEGIDCEIINLRTLRPLDTQTIINSVKKTNRIITVNEGWPQCGMGAEISAILMETEAFDYLDSPLIRVHAADLPTPYSEPIEKLSLPQIDDVIETVKRVIYRNKK